MVQEPALLNSDFCHFQLHQHVLLISKCFEFLITSTDHSTPPRPGLLQFSSNTELLQ